YTCARFLIFLFRICAWIALVPSTFVFVWCLVLVVPPVYQNGLNDDTIRNGRGGIRQREMRKEGKEEPVLHALSMGTSEVSTGIIAGGAALGVMLVSLFLLAICDVFKAVIDTAINTAQLLEHLRAHGP